MRITKMDLIEHINAGRVFLSWDSEYVLKIAEGPDRGIHRIPSARIDKLGATVGVQGRADNASQPRMLFIR